MTFVVWLANEEYEKRQHLHSGGNKISVKIRHFLLDVHDQSECKQSADVYEPVEPAEKGLKITMTNILNILGYRLNACQSHLYNINFHLKLILMFYCDILLIHLQIFQRLQDKISLTWQFDLAV